MKNVMNKIVLVTGGAMGMGKLTAIKFAEAGSRLILVDLNKKELENSAKEIEAIGGEVWTFVQDITDAAGVYKLAKKIEKEIGTVDVLINNAGIVIGGEFLNTSDKDIRLHYEVNVYGLIWFMKAFLPGMIAKGEGHIVNLASASGLMGVPLVATYASTKWAVIGLSDSLRMELKSLGHKGINFSIICPSYVSTGMFEGVKPPMLTKFLKPETMAKKIFKAVIKNKKYVLEPLMVKPTPILKALLPTSAFEFVAKVLGVTTGAKNLIGRGIPKKK